MSSVWRRPRCREKSADTDEGECARRRREKLPARFRTAWHLVSAATLLGVLVSYVLIRVSRRTWILDSLVPSFSWGSRGFTPG